MSLNINFFKIRLIKTFLLLSLITLLGFIPARAKKAINFTLKNLDGKPTRLSDYYNKNVILIDFWATWCVPCIKELPHFQSFYDKYKEKGLEILAITIDGPESIALVRTFIKRYKYTFPVLLDTESKVVALYNPRVIMPYTILIDWEGNIQYVHQGYSPGDEIHLEQKIIELLEQPKTGKVKKFSYQINEAFLGRHFSDKDYVDRMRKGKSSQVINQIDLTLTGGDFLLGMRFDTTLNFSPMKEEYSMAKRFLEFDKKNFNLRAGDFYYTIGRGLLFSVLKTFEKEGLEYIIDITVDGGKLAFNYGPFSADLLGGWIERERSASEEKILDKILGGTVGWRYKDFANLQFHFLFSQLEKGASFGNGNVNMESVSLDVPNISDKAKFYGEFALIQKYPYCSGKWIHGHGLYLESGFFLGNLTLLLEFKDYKNLSYEYNRPPLLESEQLDIIANQFDIDVTDITGVSGRVDYFLEKINTLFYGKYSYFLDNPENHPVYHKYKREIIHFFAGVENKFKSTGYLNLLAGYRTEDSDSLIFNYYHGHTFHYQFNISYPLTSRLSLEADWKSKDFNGKYKDYQERRSFFSLHYSPRWIITLMYERTNDPAILTVKDKKNWWAGQVEVKIFHANSIRIFYGSTKGGVKCAGGVCKFFPPFEGLKIDAIFRF